MPDAPMPLKVVLGLAATAVDEARKLPETLPAAVTKAPIVAITTAMGASLKLQQRLTSLAIRGEEVISRVRGTSEEPPSWATFDDPPAETAGSAELPRAAFDLIDYDGGPGETDDLLSDFEPPVRPPARKAAAKKAVKAAPPAATKAPAKRAPRKDSPKAVADAMAVIAAAPAPGPVKRTPRKSVADGLAADLAAVLEDSPEE